MLRTVEETAIQLGVSKTTIYNKLKMKEYKSKLVKKQGKSMVNGPKARFFIVSSYFYVLFSTYSSFSGE